MSDDKKQKIICQECLHYSIPGEFHDINVCRKNKMSDLPTWIIKATDCCGVHSPELREAFKIAWEVLSKNVEYNHRDAEGPELRAQNEANYRRSKNAMSHIERLGQ